MTESLKKKIGQLFMLGFPQAGLTDEFIELSNKYYIGNFTVNANDCATLDGLCSLISGIRKNCYEKTGLYPLIEIDQEGGWVTRFYEGAAMISGAMSFSAMGADDKKMHTVGKRLGGILRAVGCNTTDSPVLDININPNNPIIGTRSYGETVEQVVNTALPFMDGVQSQKVLSVVKHFPGHGNVHGDTHLNVVHNTTDVETLRKTEYMTFKKAFERGAAGIMTAHVVHDALTNLPGTVSPEVMTGLLRDELGFEGIAITDAMGMKGLENLYPNGQSAPKAILAGCDILLYYTYNISQIQKALDAVYAAVESGEITEERIDLSYNRVLAAKEKYDIANSEPDITLAKKLIYNQADIDENFEDKLSSITKIKDDGILSELSGKKILCVSPVCDAVRGVEEKRRQILSFARIFADSIDNADSCVSSLDGVTSEVEQAVNGEYDAYVIGIFDANSYRSQLDIVKMIEKTGKPVIAVLLRSPYDYRYVKECNAVITGYEYTTQSAKAIAKAIKTNDYRGKMPVTLPLE